MRKSKMILIRVTSRINPDYSLTHKKGDTFNLFSEKSDIDFGTFNKSRLISNGWTQKQLNFVKKHGTQNFKQTIRKK